MEKQPEKPKYPTLEAFERMTVDDKVRLFTGLPIPTQKLLIGISAFASSVKPEMAQPVSRITQEEFEEAQRVLAETPFFSTEDGRLQVADSMRVFINTDLKQLWGQRKQSKKP